MASEKTKPARRFGAGLRRLIERPGSVRLTKFSKLLPDIEARGDAVSKLSDDELREAAKKLRDEASFDKPQLIEFCALGREASDRALGERPYDVQMLGVLGLLSGHVVQMATGEGKTLVGALAASGFALQGKGVHVISVNDYLARRDSDWMRPVFDALGVSVDWVEPSRTHAERQDAYAAKVTYGAVSEIGFDVLRDRMVSDASDRVQPEPDVAIIDEADSVLVDEARVPLVMAGSVDAGYADEEVAKVVRRLREGLHFETDDDRKNAWLTTAGASVVEKSLDVDLYEEGSDRLAAVNVALHAHALLTRDVDYLVRDDKVQLINASRGRVAELQRWPDGLQAAVEAKEQLPASDHGEVLDSITVQALIARYPTVAGMTGTATAVAELLREFYKLEVAVIDPHRPNIREDNPDRIFAFPSDKLRAIVDEIKKVHAEKRPILVGTQDVAESEELADKLVKAGLKPTVLNARNDAEEASIIAEAGKLGALTVSTQMAGRGTDIRLGGSDVDTAEREKIVELGGLYVIGTARYPSSRLDDQLRGRAGRQGDPGGSQFFASLNDDLVMSGAPEVPSGIHPDDDGEITDAAAKRHLDHAQRVVEGANLEIHRNTWRYTQLIERQRRDLLVFRDEVLTGDGAAEHVKSSAKDAYDAAVEEAGADVVAKACRQIMLFHVDQLWSDHLAFLADVRESIHLRALGRETPIDEFHRAAIPEFHKIIGEAKERSVATFSDAKITADGVNLAGTGVQKPTSTWTYLVHDNPFDSDAEQALKKVRGMLRKRR